MIPWTGYESGNMDKHPEREDVCSFQNPKTGILGSERGPLIARGYS